MLSKKSMTKIGVIILVISILSIVFVLSQITKSETQINATASSIKQGNSEWQFLKHSGLQADLFYTNYTQTSDGKITICLTMKIPTKISLLDTKALIGELRQNNITRKTLSQTDYVLSTSGSGANTILNFACLTTNKSYADWIKIGEGTDIFVYQNLSMIDYDFGDIKFNATLYKNVSGTFQTQINDIYVYYNNNTYKFGANDTSNTGIEQYKYVVSGNSYAYYNQRYVWYKNESDEYDIDFNDVCSKTNSSCSFTRTDNFTISLTFFSNSSIDPTVTFYPNSTGANGWSSADVNGVTNNPASSLSEVTNILSASELQQMSVSDNDRYQTSAGQFSEKYPEVQLHFRLSDAVGSITGLGLLAEGYGTGDSNNFQMYIWNYTSGAYVLCASHITGSDATITKTFTNATNFMNATKDVYVLLVGGVAVGGFGNLYVDYVRLNDTTADAGDVTAPKVILKQPINGTIVTNSNVSFAVDMTDETALQNSTLYIWNTTNNLIYNTTITRSGTSNSTNISYILPATGLFKWNYLVCDSSSNCAYNSTNWTVDNRNQIELKLIHPTIQLNVTQNQTFNVAVNVTCWNKNCGEINVSLDPEQEITKTYYPNNNGNASYGIEGVNVSSLYNLNSPTTTYYNPVELASISDVGNTTGVATSLEFLPITSGRSGHYIVFNITDDLLTIQNITISMAYSPTSASGGGTYRGVGLYIENLNTKKWDLLQQKTNPDMGTKYNHTGIISINISNYVNVTQSGNFIYALAFFNFTSRGVQQETIGLTLYYAQLNITKFSKGSLISSVAGTTPFYTTIPNPFNITLNAGQSQIVNFTVNATGLINKLYDSFFVYANQSSSTSYSNITSKFSVYINSSKQSSPTDTVYPIFSNYKDNNASLTNSGIGIFNLTVTNNNGTVFLEINNTNITATNSSATFFNATYNFTLGGMYSYRWISFGNGPDNNINISNSINYTVNIDLTIPNLLIRFPANTTYSISRLDFNITANENLSWCNFTLTNWVSKLGMSSFNSTYFNFTNSSIPDGQYTAKFKCSDLYGNVNDTGKITFTIDTVIPVINITFPINNTQSDSVINIGINYTFAELYPNTCWYNLTKSTGESEANNTIISCGANITRTLSSYGTFDAIVFINDTAGNTNSSKIRLVYISPVYTNNPGGPVSYSQYNETLVCFKVYDFIVSHTDSIGISYTPDELLKLRNNIQDSVGSLSIETTESYILRFDYKCQNLTGLTKPLKLLENQKQNFLTMSILGENCSLVPEYLEKLGIPFDTSIPLKPIYVGSSDCDSLNFWKWFVKYESINDKLVMNGIRIYWIIILSFIGVFYVFYKSKKHAK